MKINFLKNKKGYPRTPNLDVSLQSKRGFTLVETLVAVSILSLSVLSAFGAVQNSLQNSSLSKDQITAFFLAQDAIEFIKNKRDENALKNLSGIPTTWLAGVADPGDPCTPGSYCLVDSNTTINPITSCTTPSNPNTCVAIRRITSGTSQGLYSYSSGTPTKYTRYLSFEFITSEEVMLTVTINWVQSGATKTFQVKQLLFDHG